MTYYTLDFEPIEDGIFDLEDSWYLKLNRLMITMQEIQKAQKSISKGKKLSLAYDSNQMQLANVTHSQVQHHQYPIVQATKPKDTVDTITLYLTYAWEFVWAANQASIGEVAGNLTLCTGNATQLYNRSQEIQGLYEDELFAEGGQATYIILKSIDPIVFSCYYSGFEYWIAIQIYFATISDFNKLLYNFTHNLGNIYDLSEEAIFRFYDIELEGESISYWKRMGFIFGKNFQNMFEDPKNYYPFDPETHKFRE